MGSHRPRTGCPVRRPRDDHRTAGEKVAAAARRRPRRRAAVRPVHPRQGSRPRIGRAGNGAILMLPLGFGITWLGYSIGLWGYLLIRGVDVTLGELVNPLHVMSW